MNLLIIEPHGEGHHLALYTRLLLRETLRRNWQPQILTTTAARGHPAFHFLKQEYGSGLPIHLMKNVPSPNSTSSLALILYQLRLYWAIAQGFQAIPPDKLPNKIYVVNLDYFEKPLALFGSPFGNIAFSGMIMNVKFHRKPMGLGPASRHDFLYRSLFRCLVRLSTLEKLMIVDEAFYSYSHKFLSLSERQKLIYVPDVGTLQGNESRDEARRALGIPANAFVILVYGHLTKRKGIQQLFNGIEGFDDQNYIVLIAGSQDSSIRSILTGFSGQSLSMKGILIERPGFHDFTEEYRVFKAADTVWLGYIGGAYGSSGILYQSASLGVPVLAMKEGLIGWLVSQHQVGLTIDPFSVDDVRLGIKKLAENPFLRKKLGENGKLLASAHTGKEFSARICDALAEM